MSGMDLERRLTDLMHERAEEAMGRTDMQERLDLVLVEGEQDRRSRRLRWAAGGAAAAALVAGVVVAMSLDTGDRTDGVPVTPGPTQAEIVAARFSKAALTGDATSALSMLTADAHMDGYGDVALWADDINWLTSVRPAVADHTCREVSAGAEVAEVVCAYSVHVLGSEEAGLGPYPGTYQVTVRGDKVFEAQDLFDPEKTGFGSEVWMPFAQFVAARNIDHARAMYVDLTYGGARTDDRSIRLWQRYVSRYVEKVAGRR